MENKICPKCGAKWIGGQMYWATGRKGDEADLAGLVCDKYGNQQCINELKGTDHGGNTWEKRFEQIDKAMTEYDKYRLEKDFDL